jgi:TnpA family transposase
MLKKLASYPKQNGLAKALREIGRIERTLFMLDWFRDPALRRRVQAGLNKGEARNAGAGGIYAPAGRNQGQEARKSELSRQWTDTSDGCDLAVEYSVYGKGGRCPEA